MKDALLDQEDCDVILVDWSKGAKLPYGQAAGNTRLVGAQTAELIRSLISSNSGLQSWSSNHRIPWKQFAGSRNGAGWYNW